LGSFGGLGNGTKSKLGLTLKIGGVTFPQCASSGPGYGAGAAADGAKLKIDPKVHPLRGEGAGPGALEDAGLTGFMGV
jgi:hypothetical protein